VAFTCVCALALAFPTRANAESSCQTLVFGSLSSSCNLNGQKSTEERCCASLKQANDRRCFCETQLMNTILLVIGEQGMDFFRNFVRDACRGELTEGEACDDVDYDDYDEWTNPSPPPAPPPPTTTTTTTTPAGSVPPPPPIAIDYNSHREREMQFYEPAPASEPTRTPLFPIRAPPEEETISRFVIDPRRDGEIGFTADALVVTGLRNELDGNSSVTFFAPTNEAWYSLLFRLGITKDELFLETSWLSDAMRYHIVVDDAHTTRVGFGASLATKLDDESLRVETFTNGGRAAESVRVDGCLVHPNSNRRNVKVGEAGMVHFIDCVLLPPRRRLPARRTLREYVESASHLSMFANALRGSKVMNTFDGTTPYTVFAPTNTAFVRFLRDPRLGASFYIDSSEKTRDDSPTLADVVSYHIALDFHSIEQLSTDRASNALVAVDAPGEASRFRRLFVDAGAVRGTRVNGCAIVGEQVFARDGVLHVIDCVLAPNFFDDLIPT
jgi:uncharacterized surface protein with fasciclin (FAS1) repeats